MSRHNTLTLLLITILSAAGFALSPETDPAITLARQAEQHLARKEYNAAITQLRESLALNPGNHAVRQKLSGVYLLKRKPDQAKAILDDWSQREPGNPAPLVALGRILRDEGRFAEAGERFQLALSLDPRDRDARRDLADLYVRQGRFDLAKNEVELLLAQDSADQDAHLRLGQILAGEDANAARFHLTRAFEMERGSPVSGQAEELLDDLAARQDEDRAYAAATLGHTFLKLKEIMLAKREFERAIRLNPRYGDPQAYLGYVWLLLRRPELAEEHLRQAVEIDPASAFAHQLMGNMLRSQGKNEEAIAEMKKAETVNPVDPFLLSDLAVTYLVAGDLSAAEDYYVKAATLARTDPAFVEQLAHFYLDRIFKLSDGLAASRRLVELRKDDGEALSLLGWALYLTGDTDAAEKTLADAVAKDPYLASAHYHLGVLWEKSGQTDKAKKAYERAAELDLTGTVEKRTQAAVQELSTKS